MIKSDAIFGVPSVDYQAVWDTGSNDTAFSSTEMYVAALQSALFQ